MRRKSLVIWGLLVALALWWVHGAFYLPWRCVSPYGALAQMKATEQRVLLQQGKPDHVLTNPAQLATSLERFQLRFGRTAKFDGKVFVYYADPWNDGEGAVVYVFFDKTGRAVRAELGV